MTAREYQADVPEVVDEETTPYLEGELLDVDRWATDSAILALPHRDPLPRGLRGPVPAVRRRPQRRRVRLRAARGRALGARCGSCCSRSRGASATLPRSMPVPKKKTSKSRRDKRRYQGVPTAIPVGVCAQCGSPTRSHRMCPTCKTYKGREIEPLEA